MAKFRTLVVCIALALAMPLLAHSEEKNSVDEVKDHPADVEDKSGGLGILLDIVGSTLKVSFSLENGPAYSAGIRPGDIVIRIDNDSTTGMTLDDALNHIRGKPGSKVKLTIFRKNETSSVETTIERKIIKVITNENLVSAAKAGNVEEVKRLLAEGADANSHGADGGTSLHSVAAYTPNRKSSPTEPDKTKKYISIAHLLIDHRANVDAPLYTSFLGGSTPLDSAAHFGFKQMVELLISNGANVNARTANGDTPLHNASIYGYEDIAKLLISKGADVNVKNDFGATPLLLASIHQGNTKYGEFLIAKGADINAKTDDGWTALHEAARNQFEDMAVLLIMHGADVNARDKDGKTPYDIATKSGNNAFAALFAPTPKGITPSFNCSNLKALASIDSKICTFPPLADLDRKLANEYVTALKAARNPQNVKDEQRAWLKSRDKKCNESSSECPISALLDMYKQQISRLNEIKNSPSSDDDKKLETYIRSGDTGTLTIRKPDSEIKIFSIESIGGNCHTCSVTGRLINDVGKPDDDGTEDKEPSCLIEFSKSGNSILIAPNTSEACRYYCGMRASFDGVYNKPSDSCTAEARTKRYGSATKQYKAKEFLKSEHTLKALISECKDFMSYIELDRVKNDLALSQFHQGYPQKCLMTLNDTIAAHYRNEADLKGSMPPCDFDNYSDVAQSTWLNRSICRKQINK